MTRYNSPLRYPGGKQKLASFVQKIICLNKLQDCKYAEPYAGGAGVALDLLFSELASSVYLNDLDVAVFSFWKSVVEHPDDLIKRIQDTSVTMASWKKARKVYLNPADHSEIELGFATFFLNRTNRSGILRGGVIGGQDQTGEWKLDARFNKPALTKRIARIASYKNRIKLYNLDAAIFLQTVAAKLPGKAFVYLDPPYYEEGPKLYKNHYKPKDHKLIADLIRTGLCKNWIVSYDNNESIMLEYKGCKKIIYNLNHSAHHQHAGSEVMFFASHLVIPERHLKVED